MRASREGRSGTRRAACTRRSATIRGAGPLSDDRRLCDLLSVSTARRPFSDGNKRSGAFLFVDFLHRNGRLLDARGEPVINDTGLAAVTLLVAESDPRQKETLIRLIMNMLAGD